MLMIRNYGSYPCPRGGCRCDNQTTQEIYGQWASGACPSQFRSPLVLNAGCSLRACASIPAQRLGLNPNDPVRLAVRVGMGNARMQVGTALLLSLVGRCDHMVFSQVVPKRQVAFNMWRTLRKAMKLGHPGACHGVSREVTPARNTKLSPTVIA